MPLKDTNCRNAKPQDKPYRLYDEQGLYLEVQPNGGRYWRLKYRFSWHGPVGGQRLNGSDYGPYLDRVGFEPATRSGCTP